jgi:hypothetical protein
MHDHPAAEQVEVKYRSLSPLIDDRMRRQWAATESRAYGWGGVQTVSGAIRMSPNTIRKGLAELAARESNPLRRSIRVSANRGRCGMGAETVAHRLG